MSEHEEQKPYDSKRPPILRVNRPAIKGLDADCFYPSECPKRSHVLTPGRRLLALLALVAVGAGLVALWRPWESTIHSTAARLERLIQEEVPPNCDRQQAEAWLDRHGIQHLYSEDTTGDRSGHDTMPSLAGLDHRTLSGMVRGDICGRNPGRGVHFSGFIHVYFFFDKQGRCVGHLVFPFEFSL
jgi:hypothetical protein